MSSTDGAIADLDTLLAQLRPELLPEEYVFCSVTDAAAYRHLNAMATVQEAEGLTLVLTQADAAAATLAGSAAMRCITLTVHSSLQAVGLTAAVAEALAAAGISANVIAGYHHDHIFVPAERSDEALAILRALPG